MMDLLIGFTLGSALANMTPTNQYGGTVAEEKKAINELVQTRKMNPRIGRYIASFTDRVQPQTNEELRKLVTKWCFTPSRYRASPQDNKHISKWDTSNITDMSQLFKDKKTFNDDIGQWDTRNVTNMSGMFQGAINFNKAINMWDTSNVTNMQKMFYRAGTFNQPLNTQEIIRKDGTKYIAWETSKVKDVSMMFYEAVRFNQPIQKWDTRNVRDMNGMFWEAKSFNQSIDNWDISRVSDMSGMFDGAESMQQIPEWYEDE